MDQKRVTVRLKSPNPLFEEWLISWKEEAVAKGFYIYLNEIQTSQSVEYVRQRGTVATEKFEVFYLYCNQSDSKMQYIFNHALHSLRKYPLPLESGRDCKILKGFGDKLCKMLDKKLEDYKQTYGASNNKKHKIPSIIVSKQGYQRGNADTSKKSVNSTKQYIPQYGSGAYAILVTLYQQSLEIGYSGFLTKQQIIQTGKDLVNSSFTKPDPGSRYTAWSSMRTLLLKGLVSKASHPPKFSLTQEGQILAKKLLDGSKTNTNGDNRSDNGVRISDLDDNIIRKSVPKPCGLTKNNTDANNISGNQFYDVDFSDELLQDNWNLENDTFSLNINNDQKIETYNVDNMELNICNKKHELNFNTEDLLLDRNTDCINQKPSGSNIIFDQEILPNTVCRSKGISVKQKTDGQIQRNNLASSISTSNLAVDVPLNSKQNSIKRFASSSSVTSTTSTLSIVESFVMAPYSFDIILYVDNSETSGSNNSHEDEILRGLIRQGIKHEVRNLKVGDFLWICRDRITHKELVLPYIIERKRMDDLAHSIKDKRYHEQKFRLKRSGIENLIYLIESHGSNQHVGLPLQTLYQAATNTAIQEKFFIQFTENTRETLEYLVNFTKLLINMFKSKTLTSCSKDDIQPVDINDDLVILMTFKELNESSVKNKKMKVTDLFVKMLIQIKGMSIERALAITQIFPTPTKLKNKYEDNPGAKGEKLLSNIKFGKYGKSIGLVLSKTVYQIFNKTQY